MICPHCYSDSVFKNGTRKLKDGIFQQFFCNNCGTYFREGIEDSDLVVENVRLAKQKQALQDRNRIERKSFREHARIENALEEYNKELVSLFENNKLSKFVKKHPVKSSAVGVLQLSDIHFNELVNLASNKYDFDIASKRCRLFVDKATQYFKTANISNILVAMTGDLLNSDRRLDELLSNATNRAKATFLSVDILQQVLLDLNRHFNISIASVTGNESRANPETGWSDLIATDNYDYTIFNMLKYLLGDKMTFIDGDPLELVVDVAGQKLLMLHGNGGIKHANVETSINQIVGRYRLKGVDIDYVIFGHMHSCRIGDTYSRSSSMVGANDYSDKALNLAGRASQNCYIFYDNGNRDGIRVDLQNYGEGYDIDMSLSSYNPKSHSKTHNGITVFKVVV